MDDPVDQSAVCLALAELAPTVKNRKTSCGYALTISPCNGISEGKGAMSAPDDRAIAAGR